MKIKNSCFFMLFSFMSLSVNLLAQAAVCGVLLSGPPNGVCMSHLHTDRYVYQCYGICNNRVSTCFERQSCCPDACLTPAPLPGTAPLNLPILAVNPTTQIDTYNNHIYGEGCGSEPRCRGRCPNVYYCPRGTSCVDYDNFRCDSGATAQYTGTPLKACSSSTYCTGTCCFGRCIFQLLNGDIPTVCCPDGTACPRDSICVSGGYCSSVGDNTSWSGIQKNLCGSGYCRTGNHCSNGRCYQSTREPPTPTPTALADPLSVPTGAIVGGIIGGVVFLSGTLYFICKKRGLSHVPADGVQIQVPVLMTPILQNHLNNDL